MLELLPLASTTVQTFMDALKDVTTQQSIIPTGNTTVVGSQQTYALNAKSKLLDGTAQVLSGIMAEKAKELNNLYPPGSHCAAGHAWLGAAHRAAGPDLGQRRRQRRIPRQRRRQPDTQRHHLEPTAGHDPCKAPVRSPKATAPPISTDRSAAPPGVQLPVSPPPSPPAPGTTKPLE